MFKSTVASIFVSLMKHNNRSCSSIVLLPVCTLVPLEGTGYHCESNTNLCCSGACWMLRTQDYKFLLMPFVFCFFSIAVLVIIF